VVLAVTSLALGVVVAAMASLNVALPDLARSTGADQTQQAWVVDAYSLVFAALLLPAGALGDRVGRRRVLLAGLALYVAGSVLAALSEGPTTLIALRAVLGAGAALVMPATLSTITSTFPEHRRPQAVSTWAAVAGASGVLGLLSSGLLLEAWSWRSIFWLNALLAGLALLGSALAVPESAEPVAGRFDVVGALLAAAGIAVAVHAVIQAPERGWTGAATLGQGATGIALVTAFVLWELRVRQPLLDPRLFRDRRFAAGSASLALQFFALFGLLFVLMQYLQLVRGDSALVAALSLLAMPLGMVPAARLSPHLSSRRGPRGPWTAGLLLVATALAVLAQLDRGSAFAGVVAGLVPLGAGLGLAMTPATTALTESVPRAAQNVASAVNDLARELGGALGIAVLGSLLTAGYRANLHVEGVPAQVARAAEHSLAAARQAGGPVLSLAQDAFSAGLQVALLVAAGVALAAAALVHALLGVAPRRTGRG
jgi:EmrB/QacA subfamily drug resistance transporter